MKVILLSLCSLLMLPLQSVAQNRQRNISRIDQMPALPAPYQMRDWKAVATQYDAFVFDLDKSGEYLPLVGFKTEGNNYPELQPILLKTYVGAPSATQAEAINIIPALISASLVGIDKSAQAGTNWVEKVKDFYNKKNGEGVYLNGYNATSGSDWWYDLMPNVFFYQLYSLYPGVPDFREQFISVADQWLAAVYAMGGHTTPWTVPQMNYRGWYLASMTPNTEGVKEPEAAGAIGWLLYQAYQQTGEKKYLEGAQLALDFLAGLEENPSYELQLPYGTLTAARLNAEHGANYPLDKMLGWSFERGSLRGWGTIVGKWDGQDVSGLVGEANDGGNDYAFMMNGFQQAAALVPLVKYDKRYARAIAKWTLNLANASRLFYPKYLAENKQDDWDWSAAQDPASVIGYEALKENWEGKALYGTGDAKRNGWAATNLALYGSSHAGYLGAIVEETDVEGILQLDLNKTDFFADKPFASYLFYNPHSTDRMVTLRLGSGSWDIYDAISEEDVAEGATGDTQVSIKAGEVLLLTYLPAGSTKTIAKGKLYSGQHVIDHHYGYDFMPPFRIKSFSAAAEQLEFNQQTTLYAQLENAPAEVTYRWYANGALISTGSEGRLHWTAPDTEGEYSIRVEVTSGAETLEDSLMITVLAFIPQPPNITALSADQDFYGTAQTARVICVVEDAENKS
ncbi:MAG: laminin G, partial [Bacteroidetes bacterium]|nr:laminin G [Bacteroidota bacterium]